MTEKKKVIIELLVFVLLIVGITFLYQYIISGNAKSLSQNEKIKNGEEGESVDILEIENAEQFEKEVIEESKTVLVDFYAIWCMPCRKMSPVIQEIAKEHTEIKVVKVDIDKNEELAVKYNVMSIPTMLVMKNGEVAKTFVGVTTKENIVQEL